MGYSVGILGASGYAGGELVKIIDDHPAFDLAFIGAHSRAGSQLASVHPHLGNGERVLSDNSDAEGLDLVFLALPHGASAEIGSRLFTAGSRVVDLGSDFRLDTPERYESAYGIAHPLPQELSRWVYGLPELFDVSGSHRVAVPGCYPTAAQLAITPLIEAGLIGEGVVVVDAMSGVSGAGRSLREDLLFGAVDEGVRAYSVAKHRHRPEIEMGIGAVTGQEKKVVFTPHLVPMQRGLLATVTAPAAAGVEADDLRRALAGRYQGRPFVEVVDSPPQTRWVVGSNRALVSVHLDQSTAMVISLCAIDNLVKGAAGQAVQNANIMFGLAEETGLTLAGWMP